MAIRFKHLLYKSDGLTVNDVIHMWDKPHSWGHKKLALKCVNLDHESKTSVEAEDYE